jgi:PEGA domain-containing protein
MMKLNSLIAPSTMFTALMLMSAPSFAQQRDHGRQNRSAQESTGRAVERAQPRNETVAPRNDVQRAQPRNETVAPRNDVQRAQPRNETVAPRGNFQRDAVAPRADIRRETIAPRGDFRRDGIGPRYEPRFAPRFYSRPYVFRPRFSIGFGIFAGYPVPYAYSYPYPVPVYGYGAPAGAVAVGPGSNVYGGVSLEITPSDASVYVDGNYVGLVRDFDGSAQPLTLAAGTHQIDIEARGFAPLRFDVGVQPGQVIPYRGDLQPN